MSHAESDQPLAQHLRCPRQRQNYEPSSEILGKELLTQGGRYHEQHHASDQRAPTHETRCAQGSAKVLHSEQVARIEAGRE